MLNFSFKQKYIGGLKISLHTFIVEPRILSCTISLRHKTCFLPAFHTFLSFPSPRLTAAGNMITMVDRQNVVPGGKVVKTNTCPTDACDYRGWRKVKGEGGKWKAGGCKWKWSTNRRARTNRIVCL